MKKHLKRGFVLLLIVVQLFCLCGCRALEEMRQNQVSANEDGSITWKGTVYKALPRCEHLWIETGYDAVYVTEPDVPVLLSPIFTEKELYVSVEGDFLVEEQEAWEDWIYYCPASQYDALCKRITEPFVTDKICYTYDVYDDDYEYHTEYYTLTEKQIAAITHVLQEIEPTAMQAEWLPGYEWSVQLMECSEDMLLRRESLEIAVNGSSYCIFAYTDTEVLVYTVPSTLASVFEQITAAYLDAYETFLGDEEYFF